MEQKLFWRDFLLSVPMAIVWLLTGSLLGVAYSAVNYALAPTLETSEVLGAAIGGAITLFGAEALRIRAKRLNCLPLAQEIFDLAVKLKTEVDESASEIDSSRQSDPMTLREETISCALEIDVALKEAITDLQSLAEMATQVDLVLTRRTQKAISRLSSHRERIDRHKERLEKLSPALKTLNERQSLLENTVLIRRSLKLCSLMSSNLISLVREYGAR